MAVQASRLHVFAPNVHLRFTNQVFGGKRTIQTGGKRLAVFIANNARIRTLRVRVGINQTEYAPGQPIVHLVGSFGNNVLIRIDQ